MWQGDLEHLGGDEGNEGTELCLNYAKVKEIEKGRKIWTVLVFKEPCKHKAALSFIFQCHLCTHNLQDGTELLRFPGRQLCSGLAGEDSSGLPTTWE